MASGHQAVSKPPRGKGHVTVWPGRDQQDQRVWRGPGLGLLCVALPSVVLLREKCASQCLGSSTPAKALGVMHTCACALAHEHLLMRPWLIHTW